MKLVFRFAERITVLVGGQVLNGGTPGKFLRTRASARSTSGRVRIMPLLEIEGLTAGYGDAVVLESISLTIEQGGELAILGRNGVGKTTLMLTLMGLTRRFGGEVRWLGEPLTHIAPSERVALGLGWVPQERAIFSSLTVEENLLVARRPGIFHLADTLSPVSAAERAAAQHGRQTFGR